MSNPRRTEVRAAFAAAITGLATAGDNVFVMRTRPLADAEIPAALVYSGETPAEGARLASGRPVVRRLRLRVDIVCRDEETADRVLDEIEVALFSSSQSMTLAGKVLSVSLVGTGEVEPDDSTDRPAIRLPVLFEVQYA